MVEGNCVAPVFWNTVTEFNHKPFRSLIMRGSCTSTVYMLVCALFCCSVAFTDDSDTVFATHNLRCEGQQEPLGIEAPRPALSWMYTSDSRGAQQTAYRILVASDIKLLVPGLADKWDSEKVESNTQRIIYAGQPLQSLERVYWTVCFWNQKNQISAWSPPASWTMGLLRPEHWQAKWIQGADAIPAFGNASWIWVAGEDAQSAPVGAAWFVKEVEVRRDSIIESAMLYVAADNSARIIINGKPRYKNTGWLKAFSSDIKTALERGKNQLAFYVVNDSTAPNPAGLLAHLEIKYRDGSTQTIVSDKSWHASRTEGSVSMLPGNESRKWPGAQELGAADMEPWRVEGTKQHNLPLFRKTFAVEDKPIRYAVVSICGLGHFELSLNGTKVGEHVLDPGWTDYKDTCLYVPFDITGLLQPGTNAFGVMLGNGLYNVIGGRYVKFTGTFGPPKMILQLHVFFEDGTKQTVVSDDTWTTHDGPIVFSCAYGGEDYDARLEMPGWNTPEFDAVGWEAARIVKGPGGMLRTQDAPPIKVMDTLKIASIERTAPGCYEADMGLNLSARPVLTVKGEAGSSVTMRVGELRGKPWEGHSYTYTLRGGGEETYTPFFTYFGFQYITVEGADRPEDADGTRPVLLDLASEFVTSSAADVGAFECGNPLLNDIDAMIERSVRSNLQSVLTDCPHREKLGWLEVAHLMGPSILYHHDVYGLYKKICRDTTESQLENGMVPDIAPEYTRFSAGFFESAEWGSAAVQLPWLLYRWYGDREVLEQQYNTMARYTAYLAGSRNDQGLAKAGLGDWYDWTPEKGHNGYSQLTPGELTATAMLYDNARILEKTAALLGKDGDADRFRALADKVHDDFIAAYYDAANHSVATGSQAALAVGLYFGLVPDDAKDAVLETLLKKLEADAYKPSTGEVTFRYLLIALAQAGRSDIVYRIINRTDCPGYGWMLREFGLKTMSEQWDKPGSSLNHCMFGHAQEWFQGYVLGIRQEEGSLGFEKLHIAPEPVGDLTKASGYYDSPRGRIAVTWEKTGKEFSLNLTIPGNTTATVLLPAAPDATIMESGKPLAEIAEIQVIEKSDSGWRLQVGSGEYRFLCTT